MSRNRETAVFSVNVLLRPDQAGKLLFERGDGFVTRIGTLQHNFQNLLAEIALARHHRLKAIGIRAVLDERFSVR